MAVLRILAIETTDHVGSVAALEGERVLAAHDLSADRRSASSLTPGIKQLLAEVSWRPNEVQLIAVPTGPGSFTGLRVGVTAAKTLAYATGAEVLGVNTLAVIAAQAPIAAARLHVASDGQRQEVFAAVFRTSGESPPEMTTPTEILSRTDWLKQLAPNDAVTGPILDRCRDALPAGVQIVDAQYWRPTAAHVGRIAAHAYAAGQRSDVWGLLPEYFRKSAAEETWDARAKS